jgi:hypothetical protein
MMLTVFVIGLFIGSNLGVMLMCVFQISKRSERVDIEAEMASVPVSIDR